MLGHKYRKELTQSEIEAVISLTASMKIDDSFDLWEATDGTDWFMDFESNSRMPLRKGLLILNEAIAYPLSHENLTPDQCETIVNLFKEFKVGNNDWYEWLLKKEEEECQAVP